MMTIDLGDRVRIAAAPHAPVLTISALYLHGNPEVTWVACSWKRGAQLVHFRVSELAREGA